MASRLVPLGGGAWEEQLSTAWRGSGVRDEVTAWGPGGRREGRTGPAAPRHRDTHTHTHTQRGMVAVEGTAKCGLGRPVRAPSPRARETPAWRYRPQPRRVVGARGGPGFGHRVGQSSASGTRDRGQVTPRACFLRAALRKRSRSPLPGRTHARPYVQTQPAGTRLRHTGLEQTRLPTQAPAARRHCWSPQGLRRAGPPGRSKARERSPERDPRRTGSGRGAGRGRVRVGGARGGASGVP